MALLRLPALALLAAACAPAPFHEADEADRTAAMQRFEFSELHMGGRVRIALYADSDAVARTAARRAFQRIAELEDIMSDYRPHSEVRRLEDARTATVSPELFRVLEQALEVARRTRGAFDPTVGAETRLWRAARRTGQRPSAAALAAARASVGWQGIVLDSARRTASLTRAGSRLDLGGIAKGFIVAEALESLAAAGVGSALVESGGEIAVSDPPPGEAAWTIELPHLPADHPHRRLTVSQQAVSTSASDGQAAEIEGARYSHLIDPRSGLPLTRARTVTVVGPPGGLTDAFASALVVLGEEGAAAARAPDLGFDRVILVEER